MRRIILGLLLALGGASGADAQTPVYSNVVGFDPRPHYTLSQCIDLALRQNPDVLVAKKRLEEAAGAIVEARAGFLPSLTSYGNYEKLQTDYATLGGAANNRSLIWNVNVRLTETIFAGGAIAGRMGIARLQKSSRTSDYEAAVDQVILDVRIAFYDILRNKSDVAVHEQAVKFLNEQAKNERDRLAVGTGQKLNVLRAEVNLALEQSALVDSQNRLRNSYLRLSELLSIPYSIDKDQVPFDVTGELRYEKTALDLNDCLARALTQRPELTTRENETRIQKQQLIVDRSEVLPHLDLFAGYDVVSEPDRTLPADYYKGYVAGVQVSWHLFDGLATKGRMNATRARLSAAETAYDAVHRTIEAEVLRSYRDLQKAEENIQTQTTNVQLANDSLKLATASFGLGLIGQLELLQSQLDLTRAQTAELSARFDYHAALARLQRAMGSDFQITDERMKAAGGK
ncbi:MAG TPA: TolC family protein [Verrucomicrobiae bacterium]|nr:TolC family protein [Verrucomicrobiae bacterium]